jgi:hypothetical protein
VTCFCSFGLAAAHTSTRLTITPPIPVVGAWMVTAAVPGHPTEW